MTADWFPFPHDVLGRISTRIINEVRRREPRLLRHQLEAAGDDRVGVGPTAGTLRAGERPLDHGAASTQGASRSVSIWEAPSAVRRRR